MAARARVLGIDWSKHGWVAVELRDGAFLGIEVVKQLDELLAGHGDATVVGIDMPIGLPRGGRDRRCDALARSFVGSRGSSVFSVPPKVLLECNSSADANRLAKARGWKGISSQAYWLGDRIAEVASVARKDKRLVEVHPEVSFRELTGDELAASKMSWDGQITRRKLLARAGIKVPERIGDAGQVPVADILDACVAAWSADRYRRGEAQPLPEGSAAGDRSVIWR